MTQVKTTAKIEKTVTKETTDPQGITEEVDLQTDHPLPDTTEETSGEMIDNTRETDSTAGIEDLTAEADLKVETENLLIARTEDQAVRREELEVRRKELEVRREDLTAEREDLTAEREERTAETEEWTTQETEETTAETEEMKEDQEDTTGTLTMARFTPGIESLQDKAPVLTATGPTDLT